MSVESRLEVHEQERGVLLEQAVAALESDSRVVAAWLIGSLGRGDSDELSDLDLWVVVEDVHIGEVVAGRRECVARVAKPVLVEEAPQNGPPGGGYLLVLYG